MNLTRLKKFYIVKLLLYIYRRSFEKQPLFLFLLIAFVLNIVSWILVFFKGQPEEYIVPLHYLFVRGIDKTGPWFYIYKIPLAGLLLLAVNFILAFILNKKGDVKASYVLAIATIFLEIFFIIASLLVVFRL
jgi:hypothetical protein